MQLPSSSQCSNCLKILPRHHSDAFTLRCSQCSAAFHANCFIHLGGSIPSSQVSNSSSDCPKCSAIGSVGAETLETTRIFRRPRGRKRRHGDLIESLSDVNVEPPRKKRRIATTATTPSSNTLPSSSVPQSQAPRSLPPPPPPPPPSRARTAPFRASSDLIPSTGVPSRTSFSHRRQRLLLDLTPPGAPLDGMIPYPRSKDINSPGNYCPHGLDSHISSLLTALRLTDSSGSSEVAHRPTPAPAPEREEEGEGEETDWYGQHEEDCVSVLVTGAAGSGKTVLTSAALRRVSFQNVARAIRVFSPDTSASNELVTSRIFFEWCLTWCRTEQHRLQPQQLYDQDSRPRKRIPVKRNGRRRRGLGRREKKPKAKLNLSPCEELNLLFSTEKGIHQKIKPKIIIIRNVTFRFFDLSTILRYCGLWKIQLIFEFCVRSREDSELVKRIVLDLHLRHIEMPRRYSAVVIERILMDRILSSGKMCSDLVDVRAVKMLARMAFFRCIPIRQVLLLLRNVVKEKFATNINPKPVLWSDVAASLRTQYPPFSTQIAELAPKSKLILLALSRLLQESNLPLEEFDCTLEELRQRFERERAQTILHVGVGQTEIGIRKFQKMVTRLVNMQFFVLVAWMRQSEMVQTVCELRVDPNELKREMSKFQKQVSALEQI